MRRSPRRRHPIAFSLVEVLVCMAIIGLLLSVSLPNISYMMGKAQSVECCQNLKTIGVAVAQAATDNNGQYPEIDQAAAPIYPAGSGATNLVGALGSYGVISKITQCPTDMLLGTNSSFHVYGSSYEWNPVFDDENTTTPILFINANVKIPISSSKVRLCTDFVGIHRGKMNALYGDGHVTAR